MWGRLQLLCATILNYVRRNIDGIMKGSKMQLFSRSQLWLLSASFQLSNMKHLINCKRIMHLWHVWNVAFWWWQFVQSSIHPLFLSVLISGLSSTHLSSHYVMVRPNLQTRVLETFLIPVLIDIGLGLGRQSKEGSEISCQEQGQAYRSKGKPIWARSKEQGAYVKGHMARDI